MKDCVREAYEYYHSPLREEFEKEFRTLPILFGRLKKGDALREKYRQKGLKVTRYEDIKYGNGNLYSQECGGRKACVIFEGPDCFVCGIDGEFVSNCEHCKHGQDCEKLQQFLWGDLLGD